MIERHGQGNRTAPNRVSLQISSELHSPQYFLHHTSISANALVALPDCPISKHPFLTIALKMHLDIFYKMQIYY